MGNVFLIITILAESAAVICMKLSNGFQQKSYALGAIVLYALTFIFLTLALKQLPTGIANAIWAGASTVLVAVFGIYFFHEKLSWAQIISLLFIIIGLIGLNIQKT